MRKVISVIVALIAAIMFGLFLNELIGFARISVCMFLFVFGLIAGVAAAYIGRKEEQWRR